MVKSDYRLWHFLIKDEKIMLKVLNKAVFLDRDGVLNIDRPDYVYHPGHLTIIEGVAEGLSKLKSIGFKLIVITNQSGIAKSIYGHEDVKVIHELMQKGCNNLIDAFYYAPGHPNISESLSRKPGSLMFERAMAKYRIDPHVSWMIGDRERDLTPAKKLGMKTILLGEELTDSADYKALSLIEAVSIIMK